jgi:hypothetical protein
MRSGRVWVLVVVGLVVLGSLAAPAEAKRKHRPLRLPGLGATKHTWQRTHEADRNRKLVKGCCYLPKVDNGETDVDAWATLMFGDPPDRRVLTYTRNFEMGTDERIALASLLRRDLPRDSKFAWEKVDGSCKIRQYTSTLLGEVLGDPKLGPQVALVSDDDEASYRTSKVKYAIVLALDSTDRDVFC